MSILVSKHHCNSSFEETFCHDWIDGGLSSISSKRRFSSFFGSWLPNPNFNQHLILNLRQTIIYDMKWLTLWQNYVKHLPAGSSYKVFVQELVPLPFLHYFLFFLLFIFFFTFLILLVAFRGLFIFIWTHWSSCIKFMISNFQHWALAHWNP